MIGREAEVSRILGALDEIGRGGPVIVDVTGEPGIGKTRLLAEVQRLARGRGLPVAAASAAEADHDAPFGLARAVIEAVLQRVGPSSVLERLPPAERDLVATVRDGPPERLTEAEMIHRALAAALTAAARDRPLVVTVDDVQRADGPSLGWLTVLAQGRLRGAIGLFLGRRGSARQARLGEALAQAARARTTERIVLDPLGADASATLLGDRLPPSERRRILADCGGIPLYLTAYATHAGSDVPAALSRAVGADLDRLDPTVVEVAHAAAVAGNEFGAGLVAAIAERAERDVVQALDRLIEAELVVPGSHARLAFRRPALRRAIAAHAPAVWRRDAHARAEAALAAAGASLTERARHVAEFAEPGDEEAIALLLDAGNDAGRTDPAAAVSFLDAALGLLPPFEGPTQRGYRLAVDLAAMLAADGRVEAARAALAPVLERLDVEECALLRAAAVELAADLDARLGNRADARAPALIGRLRERTTDGTAAAARLDLAAARWAWSGGDWEAVRHPAEAAVDAARDSAATFATALALSAIGAAAVDDVDSARVKAGVAAMAVDAITGPADPDLLNALLWLARSEVELEHYGDAERHARRGLRLAQALGREPHVELSLILAEVELRSGRIKIGLDLASGALDAAKLGETRTLLGWAHALACWAAVVSGRIQPALADGAAAERVLGHTRPQPPAGLGLTALAEARVVTGDPVGAADALLRAGGGDDLPWLPAGCRAAGQRILCDAALALRDLPGAERRAARAEAVAAARGLSGDRADAAGARSAVALANGRMDEAAAIALEAAGEAHAGGHRRAAGRLLVLAGEALTGAGRTEEATAVLSEAQRGLRDHGAAALSDRAAAALVYLGQRVRSPGTGGGGSKLQLLSEREREVAELVCERLTNKEIADRLVLSPKTVERHLSRIFSRLGIGSRVELARLVERERRESRPG